MREFIKTVINNYRKERARRSKISSSLRRHYAVKRAEDGYHRMHIYEFGVYKGYTLLKNL